MGREMTMNPRQGNRVRTTDLAVECWCRTEIVHVEPSVVLACRTESCGRSWCKAPS